MKSPTKRAAKAPEPDPFEVWRRLGEASEQPDASTATDPEWVTEANALARELFRKGAL